MIILNQKVNNMKKECIIKLSILTFLLILFISTTMPQKYNIDVNGNALNIVDINDDNDMNNEKSNESFITIRKINPNQRSAQGIQNYTTWVGAILIVVLIFVGVRCFETEKRL